MYLTKIDLLIDSKNETCGFRLLTNLIKKGTILSRMELKVVTTSKFMLNDKQVQISIREKPESNHPTPVQ